MRVTASAGRIDRQVAGLSVVGVFEDGGSLAARLSVVDPAKQALVPLLESVHFRGRLKETVVLPSQGLTFEGDTLQVR